MKGNMIIAVALTISMIGIILDDITTFIGLQRGFVETNPIYPYSLIISPLFYISYLVTLEIIRRKLMPQQFKQKFIIFMYSISSLAFHGFINNTFVLLTA